MPGSPLAAMVQPRPATSEATSRRRSPSWRLPNGDDHILSGEVELWKRPCDALYPLIRACERSHEPAAGLHRSVQTVLDASRSAARLLFYDNYHSELPF